VRDPLPLAVQGTETATQGATQRSTRRTPSKRSRQPAQRGFGASSPAALGSRIGLRSGINSPPATRCRVSSARRDGDWGVGRGWRWISCSPSSQGDFPNRNTLTQFSSVFKNAAIFPPVKGCGFYNFLLSLLKLPRILRKQWSSSAANQFS